MTNFLGVQRDDSVITVKWNWLDSTTPASGIKMTNAGNPAALTSPMLQLTNLVDNYTQVSIQNKSATANSSADHIAYPDNVSSSDLTGFVDIGVTSSAFSQSAYACTGPNDAYLFGSAPTGSGNGGNLVIWTDASGTANSVICGTNGFNSLNNLCWTADKLQNFITAKGVADQSYSYQAPTTGFSLTIGNGVQRLILDPAGTLATGTITMPATPVNGQVVKISSSQTVTALTHSANTAQSIKGALTTITANTAAEWTYKISNTTWYRTG